MPNDHPGGGVRERILGLGWAALRYVVVGATLNLLAIGVFAALWSLAPNAKPVLLNVATSLLLFPIWYFLNRKWVFQSAAPFAPEVRRAIAVYVLTVGASATLIWGLTTFWSLPAIVAQIITVAVIVVAGFLVNGLWTFTHHGKG